MLPLSVHVVQAGTEESNSENIRSAMARGLTALTPAICVNDGHFVVVGSGPSMPEFVEQIREERERGRPICSIKGTHDFLIENGIEPDLFVSVEPRSRPLKKISQNTIYLLASRCSPELFDQLKDAKIMLWHSYTPEPEYEVWKGNFGIGGGTTSGLRAMNIGYVLGFRKFILYGFDSCLAADKQTKRFTGETLGPGKLIDVIVGGRRFWCNGALAQQANEFQDAINGLQGSTFDVKGDGLIAAIMNERRKRGLPGNPE